MPRISVDPQLRECLGRVRTGRVLSVDKSDTGGAQALPVSGYHVQKIRSKIDFIIPGSAFHVL